MTEQSRQQWWITIDLSCLLVLVFGCSMMPQNAFGQDVQPRVYTPAPVGVNLVTLAYSLSTGPVLFDKTLPVENLTGDIHSLSLVYSRTLGLFGMAGRVDVQVPFVSGEWQGVFMDSTDATTRTGFGDATVRLALFFAGAPALTRADFASFEPKTIVGGILRLRVPLGQYDPDYLINLGSNRWAISPQLGVSHVTGRFLFEAHGAVWLFGDNSEFFGTNTLSQNPSLVFQVHAGYLFPRGRWLAVSSRQSFAGGTRVNGAEDVTPETNNRIGLTLAIRVLNRFTLKFFATTGITATAGNDYDTLGVAVNTTL